MITLTLPNPPSANRYWRRAGRHIHKSAEAKAYQEAVAWLAHGVQPLQGEVAVHLAWYRPAKRGDLDNRIKVILDALNGVAYEDDKQIVKIIAERHDDKHEPRVEVVVSLAGEDLA